MKNSFFKLFTTFILIIPLTLSYGRSGASDELLSLKPRGQRMNGPAVERLQKMLIYYGYDLGKDGADGWFGPATEKALKDYQRAKGLKPTGTIRVGEIETDPAWTLTISPPQRGSKPARSKNEKRLSIPFEENLKFKNYFGSHIVPTKSEYEEIYMDHLLSPSGRYLACSYYNPYAEGGGYSNGLCLLDLLTGKREIYYGGLILQESGRFKDVNIYATNIKGFYWDEEERLIITIEGEDEKLKELYFILSEK